MITSSYERSSLQPLCILQQGELVLQRALESSPLKVPSRDVPSRDYLVSDSVEEGPVSWLPQFLSCISEWLSRSAQLTPSQRTDILPLALSGHSSTLDLATDFIKQFEGLSLSAYQDSGKVWTIGYGSTHGVSPGMRISREEAELLLSGEVKRIADGVVNLVKVPLTSYEHAALISFAYNVGLGNFKNSTLLRLLNQGHKVHAAEELLKWVYCNNEKLTGLEMRRNAEYRLFFGQ